MSDDPVELHEQKWQGARLGPVELPPNSEAVDLVLDGCDVIGILAEQSRLERVAIRDSRLRGVTWAGGVIRDVTLDAVSGADVSVRFSTLRAVTVRDADLPGIDFTNAQFDEVRLERCNLRGAVFDHAQVKALRIESCDLAGATGVLALRGASMDLDDVLSLAPSLAREVGITIE